VLKPLACRQFASRMLAADLFLATCMNGGLAPACEIFQSLVHGLFSHVG
jgi:hypothetical protein